MNDLAVAFEISKMQWSMEKPSPEKVASREKIKAALEAGRFVVVHTYLAHCSMTDAVLGSENWYAADFATYEEACAWDSGEEWCCEGCRVLVPPQFQIPIVPCELDEIPF
jgi:hypothetical protein